MKAFKYLLIVSIIIVTPCLNAQQHYSHIDSIKTLPNNPKSYDELKVICYSRFTTQPCLLDTFSLDKQKDEVSMNAYYFKGPFLSPSANIDTINMGKLNAGDYNLNFKLIAKYYQDTGYTYDSVILNINVSAANILNDNTAIPDDILVYPNPIENKLNIHSNIEHPYQLELIDYLGKIVYMTTFTRALTIDVSDMPSGIYFVKSINSFDNSCQTIKVLIR